MTHNRISYTDSQEKNTAQTNKTFPSKAIFLLDSTRDSAV
jgi:hypothetical protein